MRGEWEKMAVRVKLRIRASLWPDRGQRPDALRHPASGIRHVAEGIYALKADSDRRPRRSYPLRGGEASVKSSL